jgi:hypothetical protein
VRASDNKRKKVLVGMVMDHNTKMSKMSKMAEMSNMTTRHVMCSLGEPAV